MTLQEFQQRAWRIAEEKGFHGNRTASRDDTLVRLCLIHTEISEATQEVKRHWLADGQSDLRVRVSEELADAVIRILDLAECIGVQMDAAVNNKLNENEHRERFYGTPF